MKKINLLFYVIMSVAMAADKPKPRHVTTLTITPALVPDPGTFEVRPKTILFTAPTGETYEYERMDKLPDGRIVASRDPEVMELCLKRFKAELDGSKPRCPVIFQSGQWGRFITRVLREHPLEHPVE